MENPVTHMSILINCIAKMQDSNLKLERIGMVSKLLAQPFLKPCQWYLILWFWRINLHTSLGKKNTVCNITAQCHKEISVPLSLFTESMLTERRIKILCTLAMSRCTLLSNMKDRFRGYNFCLQLLHAISRAPAPIFLCLTCRVKAMSGQLLQLLVSRESRSKLHDILVTNFSKEAM